MRKWLILLILLMASFAQAENMTWNGVNYTCTPEGTPIPVTCTSFTYSDWGVCQPNSIQARTVLSSLPANCKGGSPVLLQSCAYNPPAPPTECDTSYSGGISRVAIGISAGITRCFAFNVPANKPAMQVQVIGSTLDTNATFTWRFPDGRMFPSSGTWSILGPGNDSINWIIRSQATYSPNIPDSYVPAGQHIMTITGPLSGYMGVTF